MSKKLGMVYFPGGKDRYVESLIKLLDFVQESNPSQDRLIGWFREAFRRITSTNVINSCIGMVEGMGLIIKRENRFLLSAEARDFFLTHDNKLLYQKLSDNFVGISEIHHLIQEKPATLDDVVSELRSTMDVSWERADQWRIRLNWLLSLGYIKEVDHKYYHSDQHESILENFVATEQQIPKHSQIQDIIVEIGRINNFITEKEYPVGNFLIDVVWKRRADGVPSFAWEVVLASNLLRNALSNLKQASELWNSRLFLVTTEELEQKARETLHAAFSEIESKTTTTNTKYMRGFYEDAQKESERITRMGFIKRLLMKAPQKKP